MADDSTKQDPFQSNNDLPDDKNLDVHNSIQKSQKQPEDYATPYTPAEDVRSRLEPTSEHTDSASNIDSDQLYQENLEAAAGVELPSEPAVTDYNPEEDRRRKSA